MWANCAAILAFFFWVGSSSETHVAPCWSEEFLAKFYTNASIQSANNSISEWNGRLLTTNEHDLFRMKGSTSPGS